MFKEIACLRCKYGTMNDIVTTEVINKLTRITRRCTTCGETLSTYKYDNGGTVIGNMPPPAPATMPDLVGDLRDETGELIERWPDGT